MKDIRDLYQFQKETGEDKLSDKLLFPAFYQPNGKKKLLFVQPKINRDELFTMISPAMMMNTHSKTIGCCITGMDADKKELDSNTESITINYEDSTIADAIILPFSHENLSVTIEGEEKCVYDQLRANNPLVKIIFTVDFNFYDVPKSHYNYNQIHQNIQHIENNIRYADRILVANEKLPAYIMKKLELPGIRATIIPYYFGLFHFTDIDFDKKPETLRSEKVRIVVPSDLFRRPDIEYYEDIYLWLQNDMKKHVELVFYGFHPNAEIKLNDHRDGLIDNKQLFPKLKGRTKPKYFTGYHRIKRNDYQYHFKNFYNLNADLALFLHAPKNKFWEYSARDIDLLLAIYLEIPVVSTLPMTGFPDFNDKENIKQYLKEFIEDVIKNRHHTVNRYKALAMSFGHACAPEISWMEQNYMQVEQMFLDIFKKDEEQTKGTV